MPSDARARLASIGRILPSEMSARLDLANAQVLIDSGQVAAALPFAERAQAVLYPLVQSPSERRQAVFPLARVLRDSGRHDLADRWFREALRAQIEGGQQSHPYTAGDYVGIARNLMMQGKHEDALALLNSAPKFQAISGEGTLNPDRYNLMIQRARSAVYLSAGDAKRALIEFPYLSLDEPSDRPEALLILGQAWCESGDPARGLEALRESLVAMERIGDDDRAPWTARLRAVVGRCALLVGDRSDAIARARQARAAFTAQPEVSPYYEAPLIKLEAALGIRIVTTR